MAQLISELWEGLRNAGLPEVMLYLPDSSASRCHWKDTALINGVRVALLADQDRQIVRILPVDSCVGIGIASPKGVDPSGYKTVVYQKLTGEEITETTEGSAENGQETPSPTNGHAHSHAPATVVSAPIPAPAPAPEPTPEPAANRWGVTPRTSAPRSGQMASGTFNAVRRPGV